MGATRTTAVELLNIPPEHVAAYIAIEPDGEVTDWPVDQVPGADRLVDQIVAADERLYRAPTADEWDFRGGAGSPNTESRY